MPTTKPTAPNLAKLTREMVEEYLIANPDFFKNHPELLEKLKAPIAHHGDNVMDLQHFMVGNLQKKLQTLKSKYEGLITSSRDNMSTLNQVHTAVVDLVKAKNLEQLLEVITIDLMHLFGVDVVRLAIESEAADLYESTYSEQNYSGVSFIALGAVERAVGKEKPIALIADTHKQFVHGFDQLFVDCAAQIASCALIKLHLPQTGRLALLAFGVRHKDRFSPGQGIELLQFLGKVVEHRLDVCLNSAGMSGLI